MVLTFLLTVLHILVALFLIAVVLLQKGKRADLAGAFGGGGSQTAFGTRGAATLLSRATTASAVIFMITSLSLSILASRGTSDSGSVLPADAEQPAQTQPAPLPTEPVPQQPSQLPPPSDAPDAGDDGADGGADSTSEPDSDAAPSGPS